jgi:hypothetical protein
MIELRDEPTFDRRLRLHSDRQMPTTARHHFVQGISLYVFPGYRRTSNVIEYAITGDDSCKKQAMAIIKSLARHSANDVTSLVCEAGNEIAGDLCASGFLTYELISSSGGPSLHHVNSYSAYRCFGLYFSLVQESDEYGRSRFGPKFGFGRRFWFLKIPAKLGGGLRHKLLLRDLNRIGDFMPMFRIRMLHNNQYDPFDKKFDHELYSRSYAEFVTSATQKWGWSADSMYMKYCSEYFGLSRWITATKARLILRDHIVESLNLLFSKIGLSAEILMVSGKTVEDCEQKSRLLELGDISTAELLEWLTSRNEMLA